MSSADNTDKGSDTRRTLGALGTVAGWHAVVALGFLGWVLTWPERVSAGGDLGLTTSRTGLAALLGILVVAPGLAISFGIACGLSLLPVLRRRGGLLAGTIAAAGGLVIVSAALAVYSFTR